jgi:hypothetical protein
MARLDPAILFNRQKDARVKPTAVWLRSILPYQPTFVTRREVLVQQLRKSVMRGLDPRIYFPSPKRWPGRARP